jgi:hypothetical protein
LATGVAAVMMVDVDDMKFESVEDRTDNEVLGVLITLVTNGCEVTRAVVLRFVKVV